MPTAKKSSAVKPKAAAGAGVSAPRKTLAAQRLELRETLRELSADIEKLSQSADQTLYRLRSMRK